MGEHLDDHQLEFARAVEMLNKVLVAYEEEELLRKIELYPFLVGKIRSSECPQKRRLISYLMSIAQDTPR